MGIILNKAVSDLNMPDLLIQLDIASETDAIRLRERVGHMPVLMGGPVDAKRGFVLHTDDFHIDQSTLIIDDGICLTATVDILKAIAAGDGPANAVLALGYAGWQAGQLESEILANGWLVCPADPGHDFPYGSRSQVRAHVTQQWHRPRDAVGQRRP